MITCVSFCRVSSCASIHFAVHFLSRVFLVLGDGDVLSRLGMASATVGPMRQVAPHTVLPYDIVALMNIILH